MTSAAYLAPSSAIDASLSVARAPVVICSCCSAGAKSVAVPSYEVIANIGGLDRSPARKRIRQSPRGSYAAFSVPLRCFAGAAPSGCGTGDCTKRSLSAAAAVGASSAGSAACASRKAANCRAVG
eukprot:scaffold13960_cov74-Phaeocystis_antarctica.AAC.1